MASTFSSSTAGMRNSIRWEDQPPDFVLWITSLLDGICHPWCPHWRDSLGLASPDSVWSVQVPALKQQLPQLLTFLDFIKSSNASQSQHQSSVAYNEMASPWNERTIWKYATTPSTALAVATTPESIVTLLLLVGVLRCIKALCLPTFRSWGRVAARRTHGDAWIQSHPARIDKFGEYVFRLVFHSLISLYGYYCFGHAIWWKDTLQLFIGYPYQEISVSMIWYYLCQSAYNLDALISLVELSFELRRTKQGWWKWQWSPTVRGDFREMLVHHIITNMLVIGSSHCRLTRIGSMVMWVHDISDVPVDLSKLANFLKYKYTTLACFVTMMLTWAYTRLYLLPAQIFRAAVWESHYLCTHGSLSPLTYLTYRKIFQALLALLILLHVAWFGMFVQILWTFVRKRECHDLSEHKQGEDQGTQSPLTTTATPAEPVSTQPSTHTRTTRASTTSYLSSEQSRMALKRVSFEQDEKKDD
jgi:hypothetical protein